MVAGRIVRSLLLSDVHGTETKIYGCRSFIHLFIPRHFNSCRCLTLASPFRMVEPQPGSAVLVDGQDILKMGLQDLRRRLAIIPQDPTLFEGTVR